MLEDPSRTSAACRTTVLVAEEHALVREGLKLLMRESVAEVRFVEAIGGGSVMTAMQSSDDFRLALVGATFPHPPGGIRPVDVHRSRPSLPIVAVSGTASPDQEPRDGNPSRAERHQSHAGRSAAGAAPACKPCCRDRVADHEFHKAGAPTRLRNSSIPPSSKGRDHELQLNDPHNQRPDRPWRIDRLTN